MDCLDKILEKPGCKLVQNKEYEDTIPEQKMGKILDSRIKGRQKKLEFLVKWKGYSENENTW